MEIKKRKVAVIGMGHVGAHCAYNLAVQGIADELVLVDTNEKKVVSECQDLRDAVLYLPHKVEVSIAGYGDLADCDVIVNSIGDITLLGNHDRNSERNFTVAQVSGYVDKVMAGGFDGIWINITNPCDVVTKRISDLSGLPKGHVFGTGTGLDTSRLVSALSMQTGVDHKSITAYMLGEHGASQFAPWSQVSFGGCPLSVMEATGDPRFQFDKEELKKRAIGGGWVTYVGKGCTEYGISATLARMVHCVLHDEKRVMPASMMLDGEYGEHNVFAGVPCVIGKNGVEQVLELPLTAEEKASFHQCCEDIRTNIELAKSL